MAVTVLFLFLMAPWVGLQCLIVAFPCHTHLLYDLGNACSNDNV